jgi:hypothetical protein
MEIDGKKGIQERLNYLGKEKNAIQEILNFLKRIKTFRKKQRLDDKALIL